MASSQTRNCSFQNIRGAELSGRVERIELLDVEQHDLHAEPGGDDQLPEGVLLLAHGLLFGGVREEPAAIAQAVQRLDDLGRIGHVRIELEPAALGGEADVGFLDARLVAQDLFSGHGAARAPHAAQREIGGLSRIED